MKKVFVLLILSVLSISLFAQTRIKVLGFYLGETSYSGVIGDFKYKGIHYEEKHGQYNDYIEVKHLLFLGKRWDYVRLECQNMKLMKIEFSSVSQSKELVISELNKSNLAISERYGNDIKEADHLPWCKDKSDKDNVWKTDDESLWIETKYSSTAQGDNYIHNVTFYDLALYSEYNNKIKIIASGQPRMEILGFSLGKTTYSGVIGYFENKGIHYEKKKGHYNDYIEVEHQSFLGKRWDYVRFECIDGKLAKIEFSNEIQSSKLVAAKLEETNKAIRQSYGNDIKEADHLPWKKGKYEDDTVWKTNDDFIWIETKHTINSRGSLIIQMTFWDKELGFKYKESVDTIDAYENILYDY